MKLSKKQNNVIADCRDKRSRLIIFHGSVRSMKTVTANVFWNYLIEKNPGRSVMAGVTVETLIFNVLSPMKEMMPNSVLWKDGGKKIYIGGHEVRGLGAKNCDSADIIRGGTIKNFYIDEATKVHPDFFHMALSRLSEPGSTMILTTNPDSPYHYLKTEFIDRQDELNLSVYHFSLEDNIKPHGFLERQYVDDLKSEYANSPLWYQRYIDGLWVQAEGAIYPKFNPAVQVIDTPKSFPNVIACGDYGTTNPTVFLLIGWQTPDKLYVFKEYYHDSSRGVQKTDDEYVSDFKKFTAGLNLIQTYIDPSAASITLSLKRAGFRVKSANNDVLSGIQTVSKLLPVISIDKGCKNLIQELQSYAWDSKAQSRGEDKPLKQADHAPDALRYGLHTHFPGGFIKTISPIISGKR